MYIFIGESRFGMYSIGEAVTISCTDTTGLASSVQWVNATGTVLSSSSTSSATLTINTITDQHHENEYICRIHLSGSSRDLNYTTIVLSKFLSLINGICY